MNLRILVLLATLSYCAYTSAKPHACGGRDVACTDHKNPCQCYCSVTCGPRDKTAEDALIYVRQDPYEHYCYCGQRDVDLAPQCRKGNAIGKKRSNSGDRNK